MKLAAMVCLLNEVVGGTGAFINSRYSGGL